jgi:hypothetical protein
MYVCKYMCVCIWIYMYVNFFCFVLFSFIRGKGGRQLRPSLSGTVGGVTSPYTNTPFLEKNYMGKKKWKKTIQAHAVRLAIPGKKKYIGKKNVKKLYTHAPYASPFLDKKYMGKKKEKRIYTHTLHIYLCVYIYLCV